MSTTQISAHYSATTGAAVGDRFYVIGGSQTPFDHVGDVRVLDGEGEADSTTPGDVPRTRGNLVAASSGDGIYVVGGLLASQLDTDPINTPSDFVEVLDTRTGAWTEAPALPSPRVKPGVAACDRVLYALGGREAELDSPAIFALREDANAWEEVGALPYGARHGAACA